MSTRACRPLRALLAAGEAPGAAERRHLETCAACRRFEQRLAGLDGELAALREELPEDLIARTLERVRSQGSAPGVTGPRLVGLSALAAVAVAVVAVLLPTLREGGRPERSARIETAPAARPHFRQESADGPLNEESDRDLAAPAHGRRPLDEDAGEAGALRALGRVGGQAGDRAFREAEKAVSRGRPAGRARVGEPAPAADHELPEAEPLPRSREDGSSRWAGGQSGTASRSSEAESEGEEWAAGAFADARPAGADGKKDRAELRARAGEDGPAPPVVDQRLLVGGVADELAQAAAEEVSAPPRLELKTGPADPAPAPAATATELDALLERFGHGALEHGPEEWRGIDLDRPVYFENRYVGGNASLAYLDGLVRSLRPPGADALPHARAALPAQLFDPPADGGVGLQVDLDRAHVPRGERSRVFLQVGLKGAERLAWRRPPVSLIVVAVSADPTQGERAAVVTEALLAGLQPGDRAAFAVPGDEVQLGPLPAVSPPPASRLSPSRAGRWLRACGDAFDRAESGSSPRSRRVVVLAGPELGAPFRDAAHLLALRDVTLTVVSLDAANRASHARVAMQGQGNLHVVRDRADAARVGREEARSLARVVARALRLSVRPAPGVELVQVVGSRPLARREVRRVKARERAADRHVERTTGIASDRGADDPGLQTVIPYFLAGDEHVILVELEVQGPGPVADVTLRYKDLVDVRNRTLRASSALPKNPSAPTRRQAAVRRNVLGFAVARALADLQRSIDAGRPGDAALLRELAAACEARSLDRSLLQSYAGLLETEGPSAALARSLEHAWRARLGRSEGSLP